MKERISTDRLRDIPTPKVERTKASAEFIWLRFSKMKARRDLLTEFPDKKIRVDSSALKEILPDSAFICYEGSSIKSDTAIRGSDIDGAIVITNEPVSQDDQKRFVIELRKQGFKVYSDQHIVNVEQGNYLNDEVLGEEGVTEMEQLRLKVISFETYGEFEVKRLSGESLVYDRFFVIYADD